jgi:hypothetical protein
MQAHSTLLIEKQMAERLNCSPRHLVNMRLRRQIPYVKLGRLVRYDPIAVGEALKKLTIKEIA